MISSQREKHPASLSRNHKLRNSFR